MKAGAFLNQLAAAQQSEQRQKQQMFSDEERLSLGLYPNDEGYRMSLISKILGKGGR